MIARVIAIVFTTLGTPTPEVSPNEIEALTTIRAEQAARVALIAKISDNVACLYPRGARAGGGSGVIIDGEGFGLTNYHVVAAMLKDRQGDAGLNDHEVHPFEVLGIDPTGDVAMFRLDSPAGRVGASMGDSDGLIVGDETLALGNPFLLAEDYTPTVTFGIISGLHRYQKGTRGALTYTDCIQVDTSINPGNSGGPLFDIEGRLIGINGRVSIEERGRVNVGVGYAITINQIKRFIPMLRAGMATKHARVGFTSTDVGPKVVVDQIDSDGPGHNAGLRLGDEIVRFAGHDIRSANQFLSILGTYPAGWRVEIVYRRESKVHAAILSLDDLPLPKAPGAGPGVNPYADHAVTKKAHRQAVARLLKLHRGFLGCPEDLNSVARVHWIGERSLASRPTDPPAQLSVEDTRPESINFAIAGDAVAVEKLVMWDLLEAAAELDGRRYRIVTSDEVDGRIAAVLQRKVGDLQSYRLTLDDTDGRLLALEFEDPATHRPFRMEYGDFRRTSQLKVPHRRRIFVANELFAEDHLKKVIHAVK
jgi:S1-C subfamily serine protease